MARHRCSLMVERTQLPIVGRLYVLAIVSAGTLVLGYSGHQLVVAPPSRTWLIFGLLTLLSALLTIKLPTVAATISVSEMFVFTAVLLYGIAPATIIVALDGLLVSLSSKNRRIERVLFNVAEPSLSIWIASQLFFALAGIKPLSVEPRAVSVVSLLGPLAASTLVYFLLNSWLTATAIGFEQRKSPLHLWQKHFMRLWVNYFGGASVAVLLVRGNARDLTSISLAVILPPLLLISYLTYHSIGRLGDAKRHITELNALHLSTIETLAMAIDAKDQITHGHIRRVQLYAVGLAKALGVHEQPLIDAIEAAALLHDTGKLAVPEYILNKPGKLTPVEFEKMKLHSTVGADILSSIDFPYPVVPIVRHHHENWNGDGYPDGLKGPDIPIGARILAVVDCFDALTSDRPYRPRLSDADALQILLERRGTWYDPLVVDTFLGIHAELGKAQVESSRVVPSGLREIAQSSRTASEGTQLSSLDDITASSEEMLALYDLAKALGGHTSLADAGDIIAKHLRRMLPASLCVFYVCDTASDELVAAHVAGSDPLPVAGLRIPLGERIAGWVGANRQTILNSDPVLDLGDMARTARPRLRSCLSTPLVAEEGLVGVLALYAADANAFTDDHLRIVEAVGRQISRVVRDSAQYERRHSSLRDSVTGLPNLERLNQLTPTDVGLSPEAAAQPLSLLFLDVDRLKEINQHAGRDAGDAVLAHVAHAIRRVLRGADILFRYAGDEFVVLLSQTDSETAHLIAARVRSVLAASPYGLPDGRSLPILVTIGIASYPMDGTSLTELISAARHRLVVGADLPGSSASAVH